MTAPSRTGIEPRGPRVVAGITAVILLVVIALALLGLTPPAAILLGAQAVVFLIAAVLGVQRHPYGYLYKAFVRPRLKPPVELEDPAPPTFAQGVGLFVVASTRPPPPRRPLRPRHRRRRGVRRRVPQLGVRLLPGLPELPASRPHRDHPRKPAAA